MPLLALHYTFICITWNGILIWDLDVAPNYTLKANLKRLISQATKSEIWP